MPERRLIICLLIFTMGIAIVFTKIVPLNPSSFRPSFSVIRFVRTCRELNGKDFSFENIEKLYGRCINTNKHQSNLEPCSEAHMMSYKRLKNEPRIIGRTAEGVDQTVERNFVVFRSSIEGDWQCRITSIEPNIRALPRFFFDM
jgi:hypothetical protein